MTDVWIQERPWDPNCPWTLQGDTPPGDTQVIAPRDLVTEKRLAAAHLYVDLVGAFGEDPEDEGDDRWDDLFAPQDDEPDDTAPPADQTSPDGPDTAGEAPAPDSDPNAVPPADGSEQAAEGGADA